LRLRHPDGGPFDGEIEARLEGTGGAEEPHTWPIEKRGAGIWSLRLPEGELFIELRIRNSRPPVGCRIRVRVRDGSPRTETLTLPRGGTLLVGLQGTEELSICPADLSLTGDLAPPRDRRFAPLERSARILVDARRPSRLAYLFPGRYTLTAHPYLGSEQSSPILAESGSAQSVETPATASAEK